jgi:hypothetical protein
MKADTPWLARDSEINKLMSHFPFSVGFRLLLDWHFASRSRTSSCIQQISDYVSSIVTKKAPGFGSTSVPISDVPAMSCWPGIMGYGGCQRHVFRGSDASPRNGESFKT